VSFSDITSDQVVMILVLLGIVISAVVAVTVRDLLKAAIALAVTSAILTVIMFIMNAFMAAVFELSVCTGLITVVFISAISLTRPKTKEENVKIEKHKLRRFVLLPVILIVVAVSLVLLFSKLNINWAVLTGTSTESFADILWKVRQIDVLGQIIIILAGVFGVIVLFKERDVK